VTDASHGLFGGTGVSVPYGEAGAPLGEQVQCNVHRAAAGPEAARGPRIDDVGASGEILVTTLTAKRFWLPRLGH
jgi:hypothetical protein